jgi:KaiC/GvpD/RAD55 family RecA-like ATPase
LLSRFAGSALVSGDSAVIIATRKHRDALTSRLRARGFDPAVARRQGRFVALDAAATLASFMRNGKPDPLLVGDRIGKVLEAASSAAEDGRRRVVVFGEMVALLWSEGKIDAALQLEELWNQLADVHAFSLCCAYPMQGFAGSVHAAPFLKICAQHSHVFPAEQRRATAASR